MSITVTKRQFSIYRWLSKLYCSIFQKKSFKRLGLGNCAEKLGSTDQVLLQRSIETPESICSNNTPNRTIYLKKFEKMNSQLSVVVNHLSSDISFSGHVRKPLIKFIGARLPRPHYNRAALPPLVYESKSSSTSQGLLSSSSMSPPAVQAEVKRKALIEDWQIPVSLRRKLISEEECHAINNGGAYGLSNTSGEK
ncbi:37S ribosomal protein YMR-31 [Dirofilaria immitis]